MIPNKQIFTIPKLLDEGAEPKQSYKSGEAAERERFIGDSYDLVGGGGGCLCDPGAGQLVNSAIGQMIFTFANRKEFRFWEVLSYDPDESF